MDNQPPSSTNLNPLQPPRAQPVIPQPVQPNTGQAPKPPQLTDEQARSLLTINKLDSGSGQKASKKFLVLVIASIVAIVALTLFIEARNHVTSSKTNSSSSNYITSPSKNPFTTNGSVDSQVKYCSNPINAQLTC